MGRRLFYRPGSWYRQDDRTGFPRRAEDTRQQWNGIIVGENVWEPRQPQDLVKGVKDDQSVPQARPKPPTAYVGPQSEDMSANSAVGANLIPMQTLTGFRPGDRVGVMLSTGAYFYTHVLAFLGLSLALLEALPQTARAGDVVTDFGPGDDPLPFNNFLLQENGYLIALTQGGYLGIE